MIDNITQFDATRERRADRPPPLSDVELIQLRKMLTDFHAIQACCPIARRSLEDTGPALPVNA